MTLLRRRWRSRSSARPSRKKIFFLVLLIFSFFSVQSFIFIEKNLRPPLLHAAKIRIKQVATESINSAITEQIAKNAAYDKLIDWQIDRQGKIQGFMLNYAEHMKISAETVKIVQNTLDEMTKVPEHIPLAQALDSVLLAAFSPDITVKLIPLGAIKAELNTRQRDAGINMVLVEVYIRITAEVAIIIPFDVAPEIVTAEVPISYLLVVGDVPMYYFDNKGNPVGEVGNDAPLPNISLPSPSEISRQAEEDLETGISVE